MKKNKFNIKQLREENGTMETILMHTYITLLKTYHVHPQRAYMIQYRVKKILLSAGYIEKPKR